MKALLFDFGGTIDTGGIHWFEKFLDMYLGLGIIIDRNVFREAFKYSERQMSLIDAGKLNFNETFTKKIEFHFDYLKKHDKLPFIYDAHQFSKNLAKKCRQEVEMNIKKNNAILSFLSQNFHMVLVSNFYGNLSLICRELGIDKYFNCMIDSTLVGLRKPDPAIFSLALEKIQCSPEEAIVVGDSYGNDILPAHSLGCKTVWLKVKAWQENNDETCADYIIEEFSELKNIAARFQEPSHQRTVF